LLGGGFDGLDGLLDGGDSHLVEGAFGKSAGGTFIVEF
jgi:hypothetical protein